MVDELDKIKELYIFDESLSSGSVSMAKSGYVESIDHENLIIAACNPLGGKYNRLNGF